MKYYKFELSMLWANIVSIVLLIVGTIIAFITYGAIYDPNTTMVIALFELVIYLIMHEILHGLAFSCFCKNKNNVKYGAMLEKGVLYAMCQERIPKKGAYISLLTPTVVLTGIILIIAYVFRVDDLVFLGVFNLAGAAGDILMTLFLTKLPKDVQYIDYDNVIGFYLLSKKDLSKYKSIFVKYVESGTDSDKLINKDIKPVAITKASWIIFIVFFLIALLPTIIDYI